MERSEAGEKREHSTARRESVKRKSLLPVREKGPKRNCSEKSPRRSVRARPAGGTRSAFGHEPIKLFAVLGAANRVDIFGEFALRLVKLAALFVEPGELGSAPFVESGVAGRSAVGAACAVHCAAPPRRRIARHHATRILPFVGRQRLQIRSAVAALPELVSEDRETDRPKDNETKNHGDDFERRPARTAAAAPPGARPLARAEFASAVRTTTHSAICSAHTEPPCPLASAAPSERSLTPV